VSPAARSRFKFSFPGFVDHTIARLVLDCFTRHTLVHALNSASALDLTG
jgi:hypothetical protein